MDIQLNAYPQVILLVLFRFTAILTTVPFFGLTRGSTRLRVSLALLIALMLIPALPPEWINAARQIRTIPEILLAALNEVLLGAGIGLICSTFITTSMVAGTIIARGTSLMMARSLDPNIDIQSTVPSQILSMIFILITILLNGHLALLKILAESYSYSPEPLFWLNDNFISILLSAGSIMFTWGLTLALPVMCCSLIINICMALLARLAPDFNVLFLSLPVRLAGGLAVFGLLLRFGSGFFQKLFDLMMQHVSHVITG